jgi:GT2 family glycosyltransferase
LVEYSVIIPTYNRPAQLLACLKRLQQCSPPDGGWEVIVVNDGGSSSLDARHHALRFPVRLTLMDIEHKGPAAARNAGARAAKGRYLLFTDDDCIPDVEWLVEMGQVLYTHPGSITGGRTINHPLSDSYALVNQLQAGIISKRYRQSAPDLLFFPSNNMALPARLFDAVGGFDETMPFAAAEDRDFCDRLAIAGAVFVVASGAVIHHSHALRLGSFCRQHLFYGRGAAMFHRRRRRRHRSSGRQPFSFYWGLVAAPLWNVKGLKAFACCGLMALSQLLTVAGFLWQRSR